MNYGRHLLRALIVLLIQVLVLQNVPLGLVDLYLYPLVIMLLPMSWIPAGVIFFAFAYGWCIDLFYNSDGLHSLSLLLAAGARPLIFAVLEPRGGYEINALPSRASLGLAWFSRYAAVFMLVFVCLVVWLEELSLTYITFGRMFFSYIFSTLLLLLVQMIFNPK